MKNYIMYVDGFNLYYGLVKETRYKWLNFKALFNNLNFKNGRLEKIRYFTAKITDNPEDPHKAIRQAIYLRALKTIPEIEIHLGKFKKREFKGKLLTEDQHLIGKVVKIAKFEEKGTDVNIASYLLLDCFRNNCDVPVIISNDADLETPLRMIKEHFKRPIGLINPYRGRLAVTELKNNSTFEKRITTRVLKESLFPRVLADDKGTFTCPKSWL